MINAHIPTLRKPASNSKDWYKKFHNSFYMSQLTNHLLLSYMNSFIELTKLNHASQETIEDFRSRGIIHKHEHFDISFANREKIYAEDAKEGLQEIISSFKSKFREIEHVLMCQGVGIGGYMNREIDVNLDDLQNSVESDSWYEITKGFLNVWEFIFLFSIAESALKEVVGNNEYVTNDLISKILKTHQPLESIMFEEHKMSKPFMISLWDLFCRLRNVYSHTHGVISEENRKALIEKSTTFKTEFESAYHEDLILSSIVIETEELFKHSTITTDKFYLIPDNELNIFRNFLSEFMSALDELLSDSNS